jgi:glucose/arabinose dehydrogenase
MTRGPRGAGALPVRHAALAAAALLTVVACGSTTVPSATTGPAATTGQSATPSSPSPGVSASPGPTVGPSASPLPPPSGSFDPAVLSIRLEPVVTNLNSPLAVVSARDGSGRLFVVEQPGRIRIVRDGVVVDQPFLNIIPRVASGGERGLLGLAFAPGYPADPRFFVDYTDTSGNTVISSFTVPAATPDQADPASERILLHIDQPFPNHNGGALAFGPDGDLYIGMGDGGSGGDPLGNGQSLTTLLGKILRIRPTGPDVGGPLPDQPGPAHPGYTIPLDNPFATDPAARPEIFAYGLRNPWRLSFDRATGDLWIGDVGQGAWEEVDRWPAGAAWTSGPNFGWNVMEGRHCYSPASDCTRTGLVEPVAEYDHGKGCAIVGGYVGRDPAEPALYGGYVFGDDCSGNIWVLDAANPEAQGAVLLVGSGHMISSFGEDEAGRLYLTDLSSGQLLRIVSGP